MYMWLNSTCTVYMKLCTQTLPNRMSCWAWWRNVRLSNGVITSSPPRGKSSSTLTVLIVPMDSLCTDKYTCTCINSKYIVIKAGMNSQYQIRSFIKVAYVLLIFFLSMLISVALTLIGYRQGTNCKMPTMYTRIIIFEARVGCGLKLRSHPHVSQLMGKVTKEF